MVDRRRFLSGRIAPEPPVPGSDPRIQPIGLQLYTVRDRMAESVSATLEAVARIGYTEVEFAGLFDTSPREMRALMDGVGLSAPATHVEYHQVVGADDSVFEEAVALGHSWIVVPYLDESLRTSLDDYRRIADVFNEVGVRARTAGLSFGYHNHAFEIEPLEGRRPLDVLLESTDPTLVSFELDVFWTVTGGGDPLDFFARHPGRFPLLHIKDMDAEGEMVDVGRGELDFSLVYAQSDQAGVRHSFVEHDQPEDSLRTAENSYRYLSALTIRNEEAS